MGRTTLKAAWRNAKRAGRSRITKADFKAARYRRGSKGRRRRTRRNSGGGASMTNLLKRQQELALIKGLTPEQRKKRLSDKRIEKQQERISKQIFNKYKNIAAAEERKEDILASTNAAKALGQQYFDVHKYEILGKALPASLRQLGGYTPYIKVENPTRAYLASTTATGMIFIFIKIIKLVAQTP